MDTYSYSSPRLSQSFSEDGDSGEGTPALCHLSCSWL